MTEMPPNPDPSGDTDAGLDRGSTIGRPRWVKVLATVALVVVLLLGILLLTGGGHGPGRHSGGDGGHTPALQHPQS